MSTYLHVGKLRDEVVQTLGILASVKLARVGLHGMCYGHHCRQQSTTLGRFFLVAMKELTSVRLLNLRHEVHQHKLDAFSTETGARQTNKRTKKKRKKEKERKKGERKENGKKEEINERNKTEGPEQKINSRHSPTWIDQS